jgi:hypothetical protein
MREKKQANQSQHPIHDASLKLNATATKKATGFTDRYAIWI